MPLIKTAQPSRRFLNPTHIMIIISVCFGIPPLNISSLFIDEKKIATAEPLTRIFYGSASTPFLYDALLIKRVCRGGIEL